MNVGFSKLILLFFIVAPIASFAQTCFQNLSSHLSKAGQLLDDNQNLLAAQQFNLVSVVACREEDKASAVFGMAKAFYRLGENVLAENSLSELALFPKAAELSRKGKLLKAWHEPAYRASLPTEDRSKFERYLKAEREFREDHQLKKPWIAGTLSAVIPGAGQVYNQNYQSAAMSFILNSLFLATALELQKEKLHTSALAAGFIFSITYVGNILGSVRASHQINDVYQKPELERLRKEVLPEVDP